VTDRFGADAPLLRDRRGRPLRDLRVSVTDRCNFRCRYCMPREVFGPDFTFLPRDAILSFEEITTVVESLHARGLRKLRLTGGEPLLRSGLATLIAMMRKLPELDIALTTNGSLLAGQAEGLAAAGLNRVTVSLDSLDDGVFRTMNDADVPVSQVLDGIEAAAAAGLAPVKINAVVRRGVNDHTIVDLARYFQGSGHDVRFIEFMDVGASNGWRLDEVVPGAEVVRMIDAELPLEPVAPDYRGEVARRWRYRDGSGEIGVITSVSQPFCEDCTRARLSAEGKLFTCLFATDGADLRATLRSGDTNALDRQLEAIWSAREDRYSELRSQATAGLPRLGGDKIEMSYIGG
jgi:cyclic pyranopterin phosphate synthase